MELSVTVVISDKVPMGMAKLNEQVTVSLFTPCSRGPMTGLTEGWEHFVCICGKKMDFNLIWEYGWGFS